jgi:acyl carrier protein
MDQIETRVAHCFNNVFPALTANELSGASMTSLAAWDSMAHIRLLSSMSEEFGLELEMEDFDQLVSYALIVSFVRERSSSSH